MIETPVVISSPDIESALSYLEEHLADSTLVNCIGPSALRSEVDSIVTVTTSRPPPDLPFTKELESPVRPCEEWMLEEAVQHLKRVPNGLVLFDDLNSRATDAYLDRERHPPCWVFEDRVLWPVLKAQAHRSFVERSWKWGVGLREVICFAQAPLSLATTFETRILSEGDLMAIAASLTVIVKDIFHGKGYMVWQRRTLH